MNKTITRKKQLDIISNLDQEINKLNFKLELIETYKKYKNELGLDLNKLIEDKMSIDSKMKYIKVFIEFKNQLDSTYNKLKNLKSIKAQKIIFLKEEIQKIDNFKNIDNFLNNFNDKINLFSEKYETQFKFINYYKKHEKKIKRPILFLQEGLDLLEKDISYYTALISKITQFENLIAELNEKDNKLLSLEKNITEILETLTSQQKRKYTSKLNRILKNLDLLKNIDLKNNLGEIDGLMQDIQKDFLETQSSIKAEVQREYRRYSRRGTNRPSMYYALGDVLNISRPFYSQPTRRRSNFSGGWSSGSSSFSSFSGGSGSSGRSSGGSSW